MSMELTEKELSQISGGAPGGSSGSIKGWVCKYCGHIQGTWQEGDGVMLQRNRRTVNPELRSCLTPTANA